MTHLIPLFILTWALNGYFSQIIDLIQLLLINYSRLQIHCFLVLNQICCLAWLGIDFLIIVNWRAFHNRLCNLAFFKNIYLHFQIFDNEIIFQSVKKMHVINMNFWKTLANNILIDLKIFINFLYLRLKLLLYSLFYSW